MAEKNIIIFTDLDGTLLDLNTYSYQEAKEALHLVKSKRIPLIFCSAKTRTEQEFYQRELNINDPFIVENGGAIFISKDYFKGPYNYHKTFNDCDVIELGLPYTKVRQILEEVREETQIAFKGYGDMDAGEVASETGLDVEAAKRAMQREYSETIKLEASKEELNKFIEALKERGLKCTFGGRFYSVIGSNDKGKAIAILTELYRKQLSSIHTVGIGDSLNDVPLLSSVDLPVLVQKPGGVWEDVNLPNLHKIKGIGPCGWNNAILKLL